MHFQTGRKPTSSHRRPHQAQFAKVAPAMRSAKDIHVAACAAAILADGFYPSTQVVSLVTKNIRDFGIRKLTSLGIDVQRPDAFLLERFQEDPAALASAFAALRATLRSAPEPDRLLERLAADGQSLTAAALHNAWQQGAVRLFPESTPEGAPIDYLAAVTGGLTLAPAGQARNVLASDYEHMVEDGLLLDDAEPFESLLERCQALAEKVNAKVLAEQ